MLFFYFLSVFNTKKRKKMADDSRIQVVTATLTVAMTLVYLGFYTKALKTIPCGNDFFSIVSSQFVHISLLHLASNLFSLWYLSNLERSLGWTKFLGLIIAIVIISSGADALIGNRHCSIGFSGVLFGLFAWSTLTMRGFKWYNLGLVAVLLLANTGPNISLRGHAIGALTGVLLAVIHQIFTKA